MLSVIVLAIFFALFGEVLKYIVLGILCVAGIALACYFLYTIALIIYTWEFALGCLFFILIFSLSYFIASDKFTAWLGGAFSKNPNNLDEVKNSFNSENSLLESEKFGQYTNSINKVTSSHNSLTKKAVISNKLIVKNNHADQMINDFRAKYPFVMINVNPEFQVEFIGECKWLEKKLVNSQMSKSKLLF